MARISIRFALAYLALQLDELAGPAPGHWYAADWFRGAPGPLRVSVVCRVLGLSPARLRRRLKAALERAQRTEVLCELVEGATRGPARRGSTNQQHVWRRWKEGAMAAARAKTELHNLRPYRRPA